MHTTDNQLAQVITIFISNKHLANFISLALIDCNDTLIDNFDFVYESNILEEQFSKEIKRQYLWRWTNGTSVSDKERNVCRVYLNLHSQWKRDDYPLIIFNLLAWIRFLLRLFDYWILAIVRTLQSMLVKGTYYHDITQMTYFHVDEEVVDQFYTVNTKTYSLLL
jgi:hypothetical protein